MNDIDLKRIFRHVVTEGMDPTPAMPVVVIDSVAQDSLSERVVAAAGQLQAVFDGQPQIVAVLVQIDGIEIGVATRSDYPPGDLSGEGDGGGATFRTGEGDRASLPGWSSRYHVSAHTCPQCTQTVYTTAASPPKCPLCRLQTA
ncbi:hypothetical protein ACFXK0_22780 [Nocardia sp. NPDC059177]|uniref:hypothetical protein n=1 Tax=Nocardia sp. NPDC059177 TaxID=3346759 RepID=UPI0036A96535